MSIAAGFKTRFMIHRKVLIDLLARIPDEHVHYKPWDNALSLAEQAIHMATSAKQFVDSIQSGTFQVSRPNSQGNLTMDEVRRNVQEHTGETLNGILSLTDEQFERDVDTTKVFGVNVPAKALMQSMIDHEIHHKGQLFVYARMVGVEDLPFFIYSGRT